MNLPLLKSAEQRALWVSQPTLTAWPDARPGTTSRGSGKGGDTLQSKRLIDQQVTPGRDFGLLAPGCCRCCSIMTGFSTPMLRSVAAGVSCNSAFFCQASEMSCCPWIKVKVLTVEDSFLSVFSESLVSTRLLRRNRWVDEDSVQRVALRGGWFSTRAFTCVDPRRISAVKHCGKAV